MTQPSFLPEGVALGWRPELAGDLLALPESVDFVEVVAEACMEDGPARREVLALREAFPVIPHGVKLSLGSAGGVDGERVRRLAALSRQLRAPAVSEHVAFTRGGDREIGHLTQLPLTAAALRTVARNTATLRRALPDVPLLLENAAWTLRWPEDEMDEGAFYHQIVALTGCDLLLDLGNVYADAVNAGRDPLELLRSYPLDRVAMVRLAGGVLEDGFYLDSHAHPVPEAVFGLLGALGAHAGPVPVILERDGRFPPFSELLGEVERARSWQREARGCLGQGREKRRPAPPPPPALPDPPDPGRAALLSAQARLAALLTAVEPPSPAPAGTTPAPPSEAAIRRTRGILQRKRVDEALPLLPRAAAHEPGDRLREVALACVRASPRGAHNAAVLDALRIAAAAAASPCPHLGQAAQLDLLVLRSRFAGPGKHDKMTLRKTPYIGRIRLAGGQTVWALKGPGRGAAVRLRWPSRRKELA